MASFEHDNFGADALYEFGIMSASGREAAADLVAAHKWFNIAALKGSKDAIRWRQEIAVNMSPAEIAAAQRAARDWLKSNSPVAPATPEFRVAA